VTVGERRPHDGTIELAARVRAALGRRVLLLAHVGSKSVPGLSAGPVIDPVLAVADAADAKSDVVREILARAAASTP
jgi:GrpB-like predicted nucleotidyltransferase (UPF0157 family)